MMERRTFLETIPGAAVAASAQPAAGRTRYYLLQQMFLKNGTQLERFHAYARGTLLPAGARLGYGPSLILQALVAPHMPEVMAILGLKSLEEFSEMQGKLAADQDFMRGTAAWEKGDEPPTEHFSTWLLRATDYSPEIEIPKEPPKTPRIFELRTYHSPTQWQLRALHQRFAGPEIGIFHRVGVHPILYTETVFGPWRPNLTYLTPFADLAAREQAWKRFGADPEWVKVRAESVAKSGQISSVIQISLYQATDYSPVR